MSVVDLKPPKSAAPGPYLGFSLQQVRLCHYLFKVADGESVSIEHEDDVSVYRANGELVLEQCKSALGSNPIANRAEALWNTFANWADRCAEGVSPNTTRFLLYVTPTKAGPLVEALHSAITDEAVTAALASIKALVDPKKPDVGCTPHVTRFLKAGDAVCGKIIRRFELLVEDDPIEVIREPLRATLLPETIDAFCGAAIGIAKEEADKLIRKKQPARVDATAYRRLFGAFARKYDLFGLLLSKAPAPTDDHIATVVGERPIFVQQLQAVESSPDMLVSAVSDYLKTISDKVDWANEGRIVANSLDEFDNELLREHRNARDEIEDTQATKTQAERGRALYRMCAKARLSLEGRALPGHFVPGAFNHLAEDRRLGWHPDYKTLFPDD